MKVKITKTILKQLKKKSQLDNFSGAEFINCGFDDERTLFTLTFRLKGNVMQDIGISFEKHNIPRVLISEPYCYDNAEIEMKEYNDNE